MTMTTKRKEERKLLKTYPPLDFNLFVLILDITRTINLNIAYSINVNCYCSRRNGKCPCPLGGKETTEKSP